MRKILLIGIAFTLISQANAQNSDKRWSIGVFGGKTEYNGDLGNAFIFKNKAFYPFGAVSVNRYLNSSFDLGVYASFGQYGYHKNSNRHFFGDKTDVSLLGYYKLNNGYILKEDARVAPYIAAGVGMAHYAGGHVWNGRDVIIPVGGGVKFNVNSWFAIQYQLLYNFTNHDKRDHQPTNGHNEQFAAHSLGFVFSFGKSHKSQPVAEVVSAPVEPVAVQQPEPVQEQPKEEVAPQPIPVKSAPVEKPHGQYGESTQIKFETNKSVLKKDSDAALKNIVTILNENPDYTATIEGYTDNTGTDAINNPLSEARANAIKAYLVKNGISEDRISTEGKGSSNPVADNSTKAGRSQNRRVEIKIMY